MSDGPPAIDVPGLAAGSGLIARRCAKCGGTYPSDFAVCPRDATPLADGGAARHGDPLIGAVLGGTYRLVRVLGQGGMARLYEAEHTRLGRRCAVKVIHDDLARSSDLVARFEREARAAARVSSDHVMTVIDVLRTSDGRPSIVAELLEGEDLQAHVDRARKLPVGEAIRIARQICLALDAAHACGIVHRDLKPSNVFLCRPSGLVKVLDFGVAKLADGNELTQTGAVVGTPAYMAPEQARKASEAGPLADIYSAGAVLYRMLTGEPPYGLDPPVNPLMLLLYEEPERPRALDAAIPEAVEAVIQQAMSRDPADRPQTARELEAALAAIEPAPPLAIAATSPVPVPPPSPNANASSAADLARRARLARPITVSLAATCTVGAGLLLAAFVSSILQLAAPSHLRTASEQLLLLLVGLAASLGVGALLYRTLVRRWASAPAVARVGRLLGRALVTGLVTLGGLQLAVHGIAALSSPAVAASPAALLVSLLVTAIAAAGAAAAPFVVPSLVSMWTRRDDGRV